MANIKKNGNLSGTFDNIVFVNDGNRVFARRKPDNMKQTPRTKHSAAVFGLVSSREKVLRRHVLKALGIPALQYFAARHRARIQKTAAGVHTQSARSLAEFGDPQSLAGFNFNPNFEWSRCTQFFPEFTPAAGTQMKIHVPEILWKKQLFPPKNALSCTLTLVALTADLNLANVPVTETSRLEVEITPAEGVTGQEWTFPLNIAEGWLLIAGCVKFRYTPSAPSVQQQFAAAYLWAGLNAQ